MIFMYSRQAVFKFEGIFVNERLASNFDDVSFIYYVNAIQYDFPFI